MQLNVSFNANTFFQNMTAFSSRMVPRALANTLNDMAFEFNKKTKEAILQNVDRPTPLTKNPWKIIKAKWRDGDRMFARIEAKAIQNDYFYYMITGAVRVPGAPGTGQTDILYYSAKPTRFGGAFNKLYFAKITFQARKEKADRLALRQQRIAHRGQPGPMPDNLKWSVFSRNKPGVFFGTFRGETGYWQRPKRLTATARNRIINDARSQLGHISGAGPRGGSSLAWSDPNSRMKLLLGFKPRVQGTPTLPYDTILNDTAAQMLTQSNFVRNFNAAVQYHSSP